MKITCNVIQDIMPLYLENIVSEDTRNLVEEHTAACEGCRKNLSDIRTSTPAGPDIDVLPIKKLKVLLIKKKVQTITWSAILVLIIAVILIANLVAPRYYPASDHVISLNETVNGTVYVTLDDKVSGYGVSTSLSDDKTGYAYHIAAWDSVWDRKIMKNKLQNVVLNPNGEKVSAVYYYETNGSGEVLLYGEAQNPSGIIIKQPKLGLYLICALASAIGCLVLLIIFKKNKKVFEKIIAIFLLSVSYLLSHLLCKGFSVTGYFAAKDFWEILLIMIPVYAFFYGFTYFFILGRNKLVI